MGRIRRKASSSSPDLDLNSTISEIAWNCMSKHRSCRLHVAAYLHHHEKRITLRKVKEIKRKYALALPCFSRAFPHRKRSKLMTKRVISINGKIEKLGKGTKLVASKEISIQGNRNKLDKLTKRVINREISNHGKRKKLDTDTFEQYMEALWNSFSEDKRIPFAYLDSLWFSLYRNASRRPRVLTWIKQKGIFSKKYVFVPIVCWSHWSLLILVHFGESLNSENGSPCMLLLDSLETADPRRIEPEIRKFVLDIYRAEDKTEDNKVISRIPLLIPKVPQQRDDAECGNYVLYFIKLFIESAPENFSISDGYPYFLKRDWFDPKSLEQFRNKLVKK